MTIKFIRWIDKHIGRPLCFFLTLYRKLSDRLKSSLKHTNPSKILFIKLIEQGSTVLAYPALKKASEYVGKENVYFLVLKANRPILDIVGVMRPQHIIEVDSENILGSLFSIRKALLKIRKERIDTVIDMEFFSSITALLAYFSGASIRVGLHQFNNEGPYRGDLFTHKLTYNPYLHTQVFFLSLVEALTHFPQHNTPLVFQTPRTTVEPPCFCPSMEEKEKVVRKIRGMKNGPLNEPIIVLNPNIGDLSPIRRWPTDNFVQLGKVLREEFPQVTILITGTLEEKRQVDEIASRIGGAVSLAARTSLRELLTLYSIADVLVSNDSGPAHFAALTPIKAVILFGPETPRLYGPIGKEQRVISHDLVCSPCVNVYNYRQSPCRSGMCLKNITVGEVLQAIKELLSICVPLVVMLVSIPTGFLMQF